MEKLKVLEAMKATLPFVGEVCRASVWITASLALFVSGVGCTGREVPNGSRGKLGGVSLNSVDPVSEESAILARQGRRKVEPATQNTSDVLAGHEAR